MLMKSALLAGVVAALLATSGSAIPVAVPPAAGSDLIAPLFAPEQGDTRAVLLIVDGRIAAKRYAPGYSDANRFISWSMAKSVTAMLVGELVADGKLTLDAPAPLREWQKPGDPRGKITLRHLLHMASGLRHTEVGEPIENSDTNRVLFVDGTGDMARNAIERPLEAMPGEQFKYSSLTTIILAEIVTRTLTPSIDPRIRAGAYREFARARLFRPAGVTSAVLEFDGGGTQIGGSIMHLTLNDWGRMGLLLLDGRGPGGVQVIAPDWLRFMKTASSANPEYGGQLWLKRAPGLRQQLAGDLGTPTEPAVQMDGHLLQRVIAAKGTSGPEGERQVVLVRLGNSPDTLSDVVGARLGAVVDAIIPPAGNSPPAP